MTSARWWPGFMGSCWGRSRTRRRRPSSSCCRRRHRSRTCRQPPRFPSTSRGCRPLLRRSRLMLWHRRWGRCTRWRAPRRPRRRSLQRPPPVLSNFFFKKSQRSTSELIKKIIGGFLLTVSPPTEHFRLQKLNFRNKTSVRHSPSDGTLMSLES